MRTVNGVVVSNPVCMTTDGIVISEPCLLVAVFLTVVTNGDWIKLYDGLDDGGRCLGQYEALKQQTLEFTLPFPLFLPRGLYVNFEQTDSSAVFVVIPLSEKDLE